MSIFAEPNITCPSCRFRHPPTVTCADAAACAELHRRASEPEEFPPIQRPGTEFIASIPKKAGYVHGVCVFNDNLIIACSNGVYVYNPRLKEISPLALVS